VRARGVVLATGGFPGRISLIGDVRIRKFTSRWRREQCRDGIPLGLSAGGRIDDVNQGRRLLDGRSR